MLGESQKNQYLDGIWTCGEQISTFGGLLGIVKLLDLIDFKKHFNEAYIAPSRETKLGDYAMVLGIAMLMFIVWEWGHSP